MPIATEWILRSRALDLNNGVIMGVVNTTPDSFSDGGLHYQAEDAIKAGLTMVARGADIIDVGGESTRPGAKSVSESEELERVIPVVGELAERGVIVSIDTSKPAVAASAVEAGAEIINDVTAGSMPAMADLMVDSEAGVVLMHMKGTPRTMADDPRYEDVVGEVSGYLAERAAALQGAGLLRTHIAIDPGIGFGKTTSHNLELIDGLPQISALGYPVVLGASRKTFLGKLTGIQVPADRDGATAVTTALGFERGARVFRVHDVAGSRVAISVAAAIVAGQQWDGWQQGSSPGGSPG